MRRVRVMVRPAEEGEAAGEGADEGEDERKGTVCG